MQKDVGSLVVAARDGDIAAFSEIVRRFQDMANGYAYALLGDFHAAQDAAQEAFIEAYVHLDSLRDTKAFPGWFKGIIRFRCSRCTRGKQVPTVSFENGIDVPCLEPRPDAAMETDEVRNSVLKAIQALSPPLREVTTLFYINEHPIKDIATFLEVPVNTVKSRLIASRKQLRERMKAMARKVLSEHRTPDDFAGKVFEGIPELVWGKSGETTYIAAVSAAFSVTDRPFDYDSLMVYSGLAFRLRYVRRTDGRDWSTVGPVGQFPEEWAAVTKATGCEQPWVESGDLAEMKQRIVAAIDKGYCPYAYMLNMDSGVIHGYEDGGNILYVRCPKLGPGLHTMSLEEMLKLEGGQRGPFFLECTHEPMGESDAFIQGAKLGVINWHRGRMPGELWQPWREKGEWEYCFGTASYLAWRADLKALEKLAAAEAESFIRAHLQAAATLRDARLAAARYLDHRARILGDAALPSLRKAAELYKELGTELKILHERGEGFVGRHTEDHLHIPSVEERRRESEALQHAEELDGKAVAELQKALVHRC